MIYPADFEHKIDFSVIRQQLLLHCAFPIGSERVEAMQFLTDAATVRMLLAQTAEMSAILHDSSLGYPRADFYDLREELLRIRIPGTFLDEPALAHLRDSLDATLQYLRFFAQLDRERFPHLSASGEDLFLKVYEHLFTQIDALFDRFGNLRDNASPELARIRKELRQAQGSVSRVLASILRQAQADGMVAKDVAPTLREGRLVIPVPPMYKRKIGGIVHDESATGKTVFIEPQQVVEANNRIRELEGDERRERIRILTNMADALREHIPALQASQEWLGDVDFLHAKACLADDLLAIAPHISDVPMVDWKEARHPVLYINFKKQQKTVIPLTIQLTQEKRILVISGPNAGGKSVCLKTVALLQYMLQCGLLVPLREDSVMGVFEHLLIDIGDEQSIEDDLSTYSSHLRNMKHFVRNSNAHTLLLIDEFGGGTEPAIGGAIAQAVLLRLNEQRAFGVITTHYGNLKHVAEDTLGLVNGAMLYDRGQMRPLFQLSIGQPGSSFAIEIARSIGLPESIITEATNIVGTEQIDYDKHLQDIARDKRYWENKRQNIRQKEKHLEEKIAHYEEEMAGIKAKRKELLNEAKEEAALLLQQSNATIEKTIREIKEAKADKEKTKAARQKLEEFRAKTTVSNKGQRTKDKGQRTKDERQRSQLSIINYQLSVGTRVRKKGTTIVGEILSLTDKQAVVAFGNLQSTVALKDLEFVSARQAKQIAKPAIPNRSSNASDSLHTRKMNFARELDLRGMRADDALIALMNYVDDAIMVNAEEVRILHGTGTGALRQAVRGYLQNLRTIHAFHDAYPAEGGAGITVVEI